MPTTNSKKIIKNEAMIFQTYKNVEKNKIHAITRYVIHRYMNMEREKYKHDGRKGLMKDSPPPQEIFFFKLSMTFSSGK